MCPIVVQQTFAHILSAGARHSARIASPFVENPGDISRVEREVDCRVRMWKAAAKLTRIRELSNEECSGCGSLEEAKAHFLLAGGLLGPIHFGAIGEEEASLFCKLDGMGAVPWRVDYFSDGRCVVKVHPTSASGDFMQSDMSLH